MEGVSSHRQDRYGGLIVASIGLGAIFVGQSYGVGTLSQMKPGFFPVALGAMLVVLGLTTSVSAFRASAGEGQGHAVADPPDWRGWFFIIAGVAAFILLGKYAGLAPAAFACVFVSSMGDRTMTLVRALILSACITFFGVLLFSYGLQVQMPVFMVGAP